MRSTNIKPHRASTKMGVMALLVYLLGACSLAPGMRMTEDRRLPLALPGWKEEQPGPPATTPITNELLAKLTSQSKPIGALPKAVAPPPRPYRIGPGDVLSITVWEHPELNSPELQAQSERSTQGSAHVVGHDGSLFFPWAGTLKARGETIEGFRRTLVEALKRVLKDPQVSVQVAE